MEQISAYITLDEAVFSQTALSLGIDNKPSERQKSILSTLGIRFFDPLANAYAEDISITSFYRCRKLNKAIGGASNSDHMILGNIAAIDIKSKDTNRLFFCILEHFSFNKLIAEYPVNGKVSWVHVSYSSIEAENTSKNVYIAVKRKVFGITKTKYLPYETNKKLIY